MKKYGNMEIWKYEKNKKSLKKDLIFIGENYPP